MQERWTASPRTIATTTVNYGTFDDGSEGNGTDQTGCSNTEATCAYPLVVRNIGNVNVSLNITASKTAASLHRRRKRPIAGVPGQGKRICNVRQRLDSRRWLRRRNLHSAYHIGNGCLLQHGLHPCGQRDKDSPQAHHTSRCSRNESRDHNIGRHNRVSKRCFK